MITIITLLLEVEADLRAGHPQGHADALQVCRVADAYNVTYYDMITNNMIS